jgi:ABC-2 type transport system permease protein
MKYSLLVAIREYLENAKTKGFWIGIMLFPVMIFIGIQVPRYLEKVTPVREFILVDQSGLYEGVIEKAVQRDFIRRKMSAFLAYLQKHAAKQPGESKPVDLEKVPAPSSISDPWQKVLDTLSDYSPESLDELGREENWSKFVAKAERFLLEDRPAFEAPKPRFRRVSLPSGIDPGTPPAELIAQLKPYLLGEKRLAGTREDRELFAAVIIPPDVRQKSLMAALLGRDSRKKGGIEYWSVNLADNDLSNLIERTVNDEYRRLAYEKRGVKPKTVQEVQRASLPFQAKNPKKAEGEEQVSLADRIRQYAPIAFVYLLWIGILTISQMLLNNTIEEKSNRIIEVLLSSVTAGELMRGKLLGIAAIGLTMIGAWILALFGVLNLYRSPEAKFIDQALLVLRTSNLLPLFALYFLLGYLFYGGIFLAIGSICNTLKEAQNFMGPMIMILMVPLVTMVFIPKDPNGPLATVLSWIPLYTPFVMMNRAAADPPLVDQVGTLVLMVVSIALMLWLAGKIFRVGILRTGQPPRLVEIFRWLRGPA